MTENEGFGLVFVKTGSINSGTGVWRITAYLHSSMPVIGRSGNFQLDSDIAIFLQLSDYEKPIRMEYWTD